MPFSFAQNCMMSICSNETLPVSVPSNVILEFYFKSSQDDKCSICKLLEEEDKKKAGMIFHI